MIIDIFTMVLLVIAVYKGFKRGIIVALFSLIGLIVGLAAALKLSVLVAGYLEGSVSISSKWLPVISFVLVFVVVAFLIRMVANLIQASVEMLWLGWVNKIGGAVLYILIYLLVFSVVLFFLMQSGLIKNKTVSESVTYQYIQPWGPRVINSIGGFVPVFKDMFTELQKFFENLAQKISH